MTKKKENDNVETQQEMPKPNPDLKGLDRLVGTWKVSDPSGAGAVNGRVTYEWMEGDFFLTPAPGCIQAAVGMSRV